MKGWVGRGEHPSQLMSSTQVLADGRDRGEKLRVVTNWVIGWVAHSSRKSFVPCGTKMKGKIQRQADDGNRPNSASYVTE